MSFSAEVKEEIVGKRLSKIEAIAFLSAFTSSLISLENNSFTLHTENIKIAKYIAELFKDNFVIDVKLQDNKSPVNKKIMISIICEDKDYKVLKTLSIIDEDNKILDIPKDYLIDTDEEKRAFLSGIFTAVGSINDPKKPRYHLEFFVGSKKRATYLKKIFNEYDLNSRFLKREKGYIVYIKEAEKIGDFLRIIGATNALLYFENIRIYRDHMNMVNRLNNCEQANVEKTINSSNKQLEDIRIIEEKIGLDVLGPKNKEIALYRLKYPESSLQELSEIVSMETEYNISKSGVNHCFRKISRIANKIKEKNL